MTRLNTRPAGAQFPVSNDGPPKRASTPFLGSGDMLALNAFNRTFSPPPQHPTWGDDAMDGWRTLSDHDRVKALMHIKSRGIAAGAGPAGWRIQPAASWAMAGAARLNLPVGTPEGPDWGRRHLGLGEFGQQQPPSPPMAAPPLPSPPPVAMPSTGALQESGPPQLPPPVAQGLRGFGQGLGRMAGMASQGRAAGIQAAQAGLDSIPPPVAQQPPMSEEDRYSMEVFGAPGGRTYIPPPPPSRGSGDAGPQGGPAAMFSGGAPTVNSMDDAMFQPPPSMQDRLRAANEDAAGAYAAGQRLALPARAARLAENRAEQERVAGLSMPDLRGERMASREARGGYGSMLGPTGARTDMDFANPGFAPTPRAGTGVVTQDYARQLSQPTVGFPGMGEEAMAAQAARAQQEAANSELTGRMRDLTPGEINPIRQWDNTQDYAGAMRSWQAGYGAHPGTYMPGSPGGVANNFSVSATPNVAGGGGEEFLPPVFADAREQRARANQRAFNDGVPLGASDPAKYREAMEAREQTASNRQFNIQARARGMSPAQLAAEQRLQAGTGTQADMDMMGMSNPESLDAAARRYTADMGLKGIETQSQADRDVAQMNLDAAGAQQADQRQAELGMLTPEQQAAARAGTQQLPLPSGATVPSTVVQELKTATTPSQQDEVLDRWGVSDPQDRAALKEQNSVAPPAFEGAIEGYFGPDDPRSGVAKGLLPFLVNPWLLPQDKRNKAQQRGPLRSTADRRRRAQELERAAGLPSLSTIDQPL